MDFQDLIDRALTIRKLYEEKEKQLYGSSWTGEEIALGLVGDVGDLAKLHNVDLEQSFMQTMDKLENHLLKTQE